MKKLYLLASLSLLCNCLYAQVLLKGTVYESGSGTKLPNVFVRDITNKQISLTDKAGKFEIKTETGHLLIFSAPNYVADTVYVVDFTNLHVELKTLTISLRGVDITATRSAFDAHKEYPEVYNRS